MFTLWYTILGYKEYRDSVLEKLSCKKLPPPKETAIVCPLPPKKNEPPSRIPVAESPKPERTPSPQVAPSPPPPPPVKPQLPSQAQQNPQVPASPPVQPPLTPKPQTPTLPNPPQKLEPPPKPPRSPSPHPIKVDVLDDIEYEEEESEEESEPEEDEEEEDSVLATPQRKPVARSVNEFIDREKSS